MLSDEGMIRAANMIRGAAESISKSATIVSFDNQRILDSIENSTQRFETSIDKLILYFKEFHR